VLVVLPLPLARLRSLPLLLLPVEPQTSSP
jgi:hypothetical protein